MHNTALNVVSIRELWDLCGGNMGVQSGCEEHVQQDLAVKAHSVVPHFVPWYADL